LVTSSHQLAGQPSSMSNQSSWTRDCELRYFESTSNCCVLSTARVEGAEAPQELVRNPRAEGTTRTNRGTAWRTPRRNGESRAIGSSRHARSTRRANLVRSCCVVRIEQPSHERHVVNKLKDPSAFFANFPLRARSVSAHKWTSGGPVFRLSSGGEEGSFWSHAFLGCGSGHWDPNNPAPLGFQAISKFVIRPSSSHMAQTSALPLRVLLAVESSKHVKVADTSTKGAWLPSCGVVGTYYARCAKPICCCFRISVLAARRNCCLAWRRQQCP
jgi:hypothetical protein